MSCRGKKSAVQVVFYSNDRSVRCRQSVKCKKRIGWLIGLAGRIRRSKQTGVSTSQQHNERMELIINAHFRHGGYTNRLNIQFRMVSMGQCMNCVFPTTELDMYQAPRCFQLLYLNTLELANASVVILIMRRDETSKKELSL